MRTITVTLSWKAEQYRANAALSANQNRERQEFFHLWLGNDIMNAVKTVIHIDKAGRVVLPKRLGDPLTGKISEP